MKKFQKQVNNKEQVFFATLKLFRFGYKREWFNLFATLWYAMNSCSFKKQAMSSAQSISPAIACTATRRNPRTSPFSLTTATL